jgi:hypothetical protein
MGGGGYDVEIGQMDLAQQLFQRQQQHMTAIGSYVSSNCAASGAFSGLIMSTMRGHYTDCLSSATTGMGHGAEIAGHCSDKIQQTQHTYLAMDRRAYERFAAQQKAAGIKVGAYQPPPGGGVLGPASESYTASSAGGADGGRSFWGATKEVGAVPAGLMHKGLSSTDPVHNWNRRGYNWREEGWEWKKWAGDKALKATNHTRAWLDDRLADDGQTGQQRAAARYHDLGDRYDRAFDRGHSFAASHVPDGTHYAGASDADGNIVNDKRPGSAWTHGLKDDIKTVKDVQDAYGTVKDSIEAGKGLYEAVGNDIHVHEVASGPSNSGSYSWSKNDKGGTW